MPDLPKSKIANPLSAQASDPKASTPMSSMSRPILMAPVILGEIVLASPETQTTVGAAGSATALPAAPSGYLKITMNDAEYVIAYYAQS